ncbi:MAG TPA: hypothetical protein VFN15_00270 [Solirubrobacterales bacterium]|nr:hypothetical protein [Solirubrobacterales bacterium]
MAERTCGECGGEVIGPVRLDTITGGGSGELHAIVSQTSGMIRTPTRTEVRALVCSDCGRVELRTDPRQIAERWRAGER